MIHFLNGKNLIRRKRAATAFLLLLSMSSVVCAQQQGKGKAAWLNGTWEGTGYQMDTDTTWTMRLRGRGGKYLIEYPSLNCGGRWRLIQINSTRAVFTESITFGQNSCVDKGRVVIERLSGKQIAYRFSHRGATDVSASAILNRKK